MCVTESLSIAVDSWMLSTLLYLFLPFSLFIFCLLFHFQPTHYVTITTRRGSQDTTDSTAEIEHVHLKKIVGQLKSNLYNVSVLSEPDLEMITNMDPNSVADITGKDFIEQLKEVSGRLGERPDHGLSPLILIDVSRCLLFSLFHLLSNSPEFPLFSTHSNACHLILN